VVETFSYAFRKWDSYQGTGTRRNWLYGIAVNRYRMNRRKQRPRHEQLTNEILAIGVDILDQIVIQQAINRLPASQREAFLLVKSEGLTSREAGEVLGRPLGTILYEVHMAVRSIRTALEGGGSFGKRG